MCICQSGRYSAHGLVASSAHGPIASPPRRPGSAHRLARASNQSFGARSLRCAKVVSPRGVAFHPQLVEGSFAECKDLVEGALREILDSFQAPGMPARVLPGVDHRSPMEVEGHQGRSGGQVRPRVQPSAPLVGASGPLPHGVRGPLRRNGGALDRHIQEVRPRTLPECVRPRPARESVGGGSILGLRVLTSRRRSRSSRVPLSAMRLGTSLLEKIVRYL